MINITDPVIFSDEPHDHQCPSCKADHRLYTSQCPNPNCKEYVQLGMDIMNIIDADGVCGCCFQLPCMCK